MPVNNAKLRTLPSRERACKPPDLHGLFISVHHSGSKQFQPKQPLIGREELMPFEASPGVNLAQARMVGNAAGAAHALRIDPAEETKGAQRLTCDRRGRASETGPRL